MTSPSHTHTHARTRTRTRTHTHTHTHARTRTHNTHTHATRTHAPAHTHAQERPTTNDTTCGPPAWLTGRLHEGGIRSVRSPPRRAPLLATPIATPLQGGRPERPGLLFLKLHEDEVLLWQVHWQAHGGLSHDREDGIEEAQSVLRIVAAPFVVSLKTTPILIQSWGITFTHRMITTRGFVRPPSRRCRVTAKVIRILTFMVRSMGSVQIIVTEARA